VKKYINVWDSCSLEELARSRSIRLFGNANVGHLSRCNLQVPGQVWYDATASLTNMYVRTDLYEPALSGEGVAAVVQDAILDGRRDLEALEMLVAGMSGGDVGLLRAFRAWAHHGMCTLIVGARGDRVSTTLDVATLASPARRQVFDMDRPVVWRIPARQNFTVNLESYSEAIDELVRVAAATRPARPEPRIWVHLEGTIELAKQ